MTISKNLMIAAMTALLLGGAAGAAEAGGKRGHLHFKWHGPKITYGKYHHGYYRGCYKFKRKYIRTGRYHWLRKFNRCRYGY